MSTSQKVVPELIIFYLDLTSKNISRKDVFKALEKFVEEKKKKIETSTFGAFYFKEGNTPVLTDQFDQFKDLAAIIEQDWKNRSIEESSFENGVFYCLSFLIEKAVQRQGNYRVIIISDVPSKKGSEYAEALMNLVETVRNFPTFIDIIRIGEAERYTDDVKLRIISTLTAGTVLYVSNMKDFKDNLVGLAKNKALPDLRAEGGQEIDESKKSYYEGIAHHIVSATGESGLCILCNKDSCGYCNSKQDVYKCSQCGKIYHECCAALYSWKKNIGLKHIFRCFNCEALLMVDEAQVYRINGELPPQKAGEIIEESTEKEKEEEEVWTPKAGKKSKIKPKAETKISETPAVSEESHTPPPAELNLPGTSHSVAPTQDANKKGVVTVKLGMFGPAIVKKVAATESSEKSASQTTEAAQPHIIVEPKLSDQDKANYARQRLIDRRKGTSTEAEVYICRVCSKRLEKGQKICPYCGSPAF